MIPKVIHYCWFGGNEMSALEKKCIESWKTQCPDYEIVRWDETNYDVTKNPYMQQAYAAKKWGFVPDYARLDILYQHGGFYLDTDVELLQSLDALRTQAAFAGIGCTGGVALGLGFGAEAGNALVKAMRDDYDTVSFLNPDGSLNTAPCVKYQTRLLKEKGFVDEDRLQQVESMTIYPTEYFCPMHYETGALTLTDHTVSIHHYESTHWGTRARMGNLRMRRAYRKYGKVGFFLYSHRLFRGLDLIIRGEWKSYLQNVFHDEKTH